MNIPKHPNTKSAADVGRAIWGEDHASRAAGMVLEDVGVGFARISMEVRHDMLNGAGVCHGGYIFTLADSAMAFATNAENVIAVASNATIDFVAPAHLGERLVAVAQQRWSGGRSAVNDVEVHGPSGLVAVFRGRAVRLGRPAIEPGAS